MSISSSASNENTYLGVDFSEGGAFGGSGYGGKSFYYFNKCKFMNGYSPRGFIFYLFLFLILNLKKIKIKGGVLYYVSGHIIVKNCIFFGNFLFVCKKNIF